MIYAIILAGGTGSRMNADRNKVLLPLNGVPLLVRSAKAFIGLCDKLILVVRPEEQDDVRSLMQQHKIPISQYALAGADRQSSVKNGLDTLPEDCSIVLVHDGARALVTKEVILCVIDSVKHCGSGVASIPVTDTIKEMDTSGYVTRSPDRSTMRAVQTPQGFEKALLIHAHENADRLGFRGTDEAELVSLLDVPVHLTLGDKENLKITTPEDMAVAQEILKLRGEYSPPLFRTGYGYDVHRLVPGRKLIICGEDIPHEMGLLGHSDADVGIHALIDAMLGAAGLYDIGRHFPDTDERYRGISSMLLLKETSKILKSAGYCMVNADITLVAQRPKLSPYIDLMRQHLSGVLDIEAEYINVKATTTEHLGFEGEEQGISAAAVCMIKKVT